MKSLLLLFILASCATKVPTKPVEPIPVKPIEPIEQVQEEDLFKLRSSLTLMKKLYPVANCVAKLDSFKTKMYAVEKFGKLNITGKQVYDDMMAKRPITIRTYYKRAFFGLKPVYAYTYSGHDEIYINTRYYKRSMPSLMSTVFHEQSHTAKYIHGKHDPIPWRVGDIAESVTHECMEK